METIQFFLVTMILCKKRKQNCRSLLSPVFTNPLIFARFYWLLYVTRCKITGRLSCNNPLLCRYLSSDYFPRKETKPAEKIQLKSFTFSSLLFYMEEKQTRFVKSSDSDTKKQFANAVPERTKSTKSTKYAVNVLEGDVKLRVLFHMSIYTTFSTCTIT